VTPDPLFDFTGKVVLITGGSRGLGSSFTTGALLRVDGGQH
jgi:hypothetical protein